MMLFHQDSAFSSYVMASTVEHKKLDAWVRIIFRHKLSNKFGTTFTRSLDITYIDCDLKNTLNSLFRPLYTPVGLDAT